MVDSNIYIIDKEMKTVRYVYTISQWPSSIKNASRNVDWLTLFFWDKQGYCLCTRILNKAVRWGLGVNSINKGAFESLWTIMNR